MRRFVFLLVLLGLIGAAVWWFFIRVTPERALRSAFRNLPRIQTVKVMQASTYWDLLASSGQGFVLDTWLSYAGSLDVRDPTHARAKGVIGYSETGSKEDFQTADVVLTDAYVSFKLRNAGASTISWLADAASTSTEDTWFQFKRNVLFEEEGLASFIAVGDGIDVRRALESIEPETWARPSSANTYVAQDGSRRMDMTLQLNEDAIRTDILSFSSAWFLRDPEPEYVDWASRTAAGLARGQWYATIDLKTKQFRKVRGYWPLVRNHGNIVGHVTVELEMSRFNQAFDINDPEGAIDVTASIDERDLPTFTPAGEREPATTSTEPESDAGGE